VGPFLARRPTHRSAPEQVHMNVLDGLAAIFSCVDDSAISLGEALCTRDFGSGPLQVSQQLLVLLLSMRDRWDMVPGDDKDVDRGLRFQVGKCVAPVILIYSLRRDAAVDDLTEDAAHDAESILHQPLVSGSMAG